MRSFFDGDMLKWKTFKTAEIKPFCCGLMHDELRRFPMPRAKLIVTIDLKDENSCHSCPIVRYEQALGFWQCINPLNDAYGLELERNPATLKPVRPDNCKKQYKC